MAKRACIVGGGAIGCAAALELASLGYEITLVERGTLGAESSWAGAGLLSALLPWNYPGSVTRLVEWSRSLYSEWAANVRAASGVNPEYNPCGMLVLPPYDLASAVDWSRTSSRIVEELPGRAIEPALATDTRALWMPDVAQLRNPRLLRALRRCLERRGVQIREHTAVIGWVTSGSRIAAASTTQGNVPADLYVATAGAWTPTVLGESSLPIKPMRGQIVLYQSEPGRLQHIVYQDGLYVIPRADGHILVGSTLEDVGFDKSITEEARSDLTRRASDILPFLKDTPIVGQWAGLRPGSPDNIPIMDRHPRFENLYVSSGHFRYGVTMAPASAKLLANMILGRPNPIDVTPYRWPT